MEPTQFLLHYGILDVKSVVSVLGRQGGGQGDINVRPGLA